VSDVLAAFLLGIASAASLGLGTLTARLWRPTDFVLGLLTAFGAGALLSAVTIDIVAPSVDTAELRWLAIGAVVGGIAFEVSNRTVNARGGFLRKASTSITFLRDREQRRRREVLEDLERIDVFDGLPDRELDTLAGVFRTERLDAGETLYRYGEPCDHLNVLVEGEVALTTPDGTVTLGPHQAFGHLAFVSGTRHRSTATAVTDSEVLRLARGRLRSVVAGCPVFAERLADRARSDEVVDYLCALHPEVELDRISAWRQLVESEGIAQLPLLGDMASTATAERIIDHLGDVAPFRDLPEHVVERIARRFFDEEHTTGHVLFRPGETSDRLYVVADGDVALVDGSGDAEDSVLLHVGDECGLYPFLLGTRHAETAIVPDSADVWVLRRSDLADLVRSEPALASAVGDWLDDPRVHRYLVEDQGLTPDQADGLRRRARSALHRRALPPAVAAERSLGAPIAIWLGLLLDAIPESLVIGATAGAVQSSFIVGIALSNYPEALASSIGMRERRMRWTHIAGLWASAVMVTGVGAAIGNVLFQQASDTTYAVVEGVAAGAMLTVITQTMMPEALQRSGGFVGLAALGGFLSTTLVGA
jgi:CRP-like cAMP-binding protein